MGNPEPGNMCVEAAVCYAYGIPHSDNPPCVGAAVRAFKIKLNDSKWSSNAARAEGMKYIAIAQLNSVKIDQKEFAKRITLRTINTIIADLAKEYLPEIEAELREINDLTKAKVLCLKLKNAAEDNDCDAVICAAYTAIYAVNAAADNAYTAHAAHDAAAICTVIVVNDKILIQAANNCLQVLKEMQSPGCEYLYLLDSE